MIRKSFYVFLYSILLTSLNAQYFTLSDESLDFGSVLVGGSYTLDLAIFSQADQTFVLTVPNYFTASEIEFDMAVGEQKIIQITFTPPTAIDISSPLQIESINNTTEIVTLIGSGLNELSGSISGVLSQEFSPYDVSNVLIIEEGSTLFIEPGVELRFNGRYPLIVEGNLIAHGTPEQLIKFIGSDIHTWKGLYVEPNYSVGLKEDENGEREGTFNLGLSYRF